LLLHINDNFLKYFPFSSAADYQFNGAHSLITMAARQKFSVAQRRRIRVERSATWLLLLWVVFVAIHVLL
jgi:hypothetical protein